RGRHRGEAPVVRAKVPGRVIEEVGFSSPTRDVNCEHGVLHKGRVDVIDVGHPVDAPGASDVRECGRTHRLAVVQVVVRDLGKDGGPHWWAVPHRTILHSQAGDLREKGVGGHAYTAAAVSSGLRGVRSCGLAEGFLAVQTVPPGNLTPFLLGYFTPAVGQ